MKNPRASIFNTRDEVKLSQLDKLFDAKCFWCMHNESRDVNFLDLCQFFGSTISHFCFAYSIKCPLVDIGLERKQIVWDKCNSYIPTPEYKENQQHFQLLRKTTDLNVVISTKKGQHILL